jgi:hypothetical protein
MQSTAMLPGVGMPGGSDAAPYSSAGGEDLVTPAALDRPGRVLP